MNDTILDDTLIVYGANCTWIGTIDQVAKTKEGLPCCPHCGSVLFQMKKLVWDRRVKAYNKENPGYSEFISWLYNTCYTGISTLTLFEIFKSIKKYLTSKN